MRIEPFILEEWMQKYEGEEVYNLDNSCVYALSLIEFKNLIGIEEQEILNMFRNIQLSYGGYATGGNPILLAEIAKLYEDIKAHQIMTTFGGTAANHHAFFSLLEPGDEIITFIPGYQQLWSLPKAYGAIVKFLRLKKENEFHIDIKELDRLITPKTKMICFSTPCNPTGTLFSKDELETIIALAAKQDIYILADEVYRHLVTDGDIQPSICDIYEKGISVGSMSKVFSLTGLRLGWLATRDELARKSFMNCASYHVGGCNIISELIAILALRAKELLINRNLSMLRANLESLDSWMQYYSDIFSYVKPHAGSMALIYYPFDISTEVFCKNILKETGTLVMPGDAFKEPSSFRISYACNHQQLMSGLYEIGCYAKRLQEELKM